MSASAHTCIIIYHILEHSVYMYTYIIYIYTLCHYVPIYICIYMYIYIYVYMYIYMYTNIKHNSLADAHYDNETAAAGEWSSNNGFVLHAWLNLLWKQNSTVLFMALQNSWHWRPNVLKLYRYMHLPACGSNFLPPTGFWFLKMSTDPVLVSRCHKMSKRVG